MTPCASPGGMSAVASKVGCCGFPLAKGEYFRRFPAVEVQTTFYQPPRVATLERWRKTAPDDFEFTLKSWQLITHEATSPTYRRLKTKLSPEELLQCGSFQETSIVKRAWETTRACAQALAASRVLFQCPASFTPTTQHLTQMRNFFSIIQRNGLELLWEPRGNWPESLIASLCKELRLVHVVDPFLARTVTPESIYFRLHGGKGFAHVYSRAELERLRDIISSGTTAYVMFNNVNMLDDATRFQEMTGMLRREPEFDFL
jgi:uncharacterized protein YecE (DUF72 family)